MSDPGVAQRASALEEKRRKLEELKKRREVRGADTARIQATQATTSLEDYIDDLLKGDSSGIGGTATGSTTAGTTTTTVTAGEGNDTAADPTASLRHETGTSTPVLSTAASVATTNNSTTASNLTVEALRKQIEAFSISTQTDDELFSVENDENEQTKTNEPQEPTTNSKDNEKNNATTASNAEMETTRNDATGSLIPKVLSLQEVEREVTKQPFSLFLNTASKKVERLLGAASSSTLIATTTTTTATDEFIMADYVAESMHIDHHNNINKKDLLQNSDVQTKFVSSKFIYECPKWTNHRDVTDLDWSPIHKELLLSTYHNINSVIHSSGAAPTSTASTLVMDGTRSTTKIDQSLSSSLTPRSGELLSDGLALIWSPMLPNRPEHVFTCGSPVMCGKFHPTDPTLVIGGCYSGQLVIWDIRSGRLPVQKSSIPTVSSTSTSSSGNANQLSLMKGHHAHSIGSMEVLDGGVSISFLFLVVRHSIFHIQDFFVLNASQTLSLSFYS